jgi:hypothetical protein
MKRIDRPNMTRRRQHAAAVAMGLLVGIVVVGAVIATASGGTSTELLRAASSPSLSPTPLLANSATPTSSPTPNAAGASSAAVSLAAPTAAGASGDSPAESAHDASALEECRSYLRSIDDDPEACDAMMEGVAGVTESTGPSPSATESPVVESTTKRPLTAAEVAACRADTSALGIDQARCGKAGNVMTVETRVFRVDRSDGDPAVPDVRMRKPGFHVDGDFTSVDDIDPFGLHWPGGQLELTLVGSNAKLSIAIVNTPGEYPASYLLDLAKDGTYRSEVVPGDYVITVEPADIAAPLSKYSLTVAAAAN